MTAPEPSAALVAPSSAARAVALLHEDYHAGKVCFATDPVECPGHQDAHDITQVLVHAGLLAWGGACDCRWTPGIDLPTYECELHRDDPDLAHAKASGPTAAEVKVARDPSAHRHEQGESDV